ncbi:MAG: GHKL domain-containing protein [Clostridia bacterium]|nr:GHKL domain-containing protein [Clostridia bacterium]
MKKTLNMIRFDMIFFQILIMVYLIIFGSGIASYILIGLFIVTAMNLIYILYELEKIHNLVFQQQIVNDNIALLDEEKKKSLEHFKAIKSLYQSGEKQKMLEYIEQSQRAYYDEDVISFDLEILNIILQRYMYICKNNDIQFEYDIQSNVKALLEEAKFQGEQLCTILGNLMDNAIDVLKLKPENKLLKVSIAGNGYQVVVEVSNNGEKIPDKVMTKLFNYGFSTKTEGRGTGLFIVYKLVEKLGARLSVTSDDQVTSFQILFDLD